MAVIVLNRLLNGKRHRNYIDGRLTVYNGQYGYHHGSLEDSRIAKSMIIMKEIAGI